MIWNKMTSNHTIWQKKVEKITKNVSHRQWINHESSLLYRKYQFTARLFSTFEIWIWCCNVRTTTLFFKINTHYLANNIFKEKDKRYVLNVSAYVRWCSKNYFYSRTTYFLLTPTRKLSVTELDGHKYFGVLFSISLRTLAAFLSICPISEESL